MESKFNIETAEPKEFTANPRTLALTTLLALLLLGLVLYRLRPPQPKDNADDFSAVQAATILQELFANETPHPTESVEKDHVATHIASYLESLEYEVEIQEQFTCRHGPASSRCGTVKNILAQLPGKETDNSIVLMAHYDSVNASPGIADNGANVATILEIATRLKGEGRFRNPVIFLFSDAEENGLLGAQAFAESHPWARNMGVVINLEARGTSGQSLMFETSNNNAWLVKAYAEVAERPATNSLFFEIYQTLPNDTDFTIFKEKNIPGVNFAFIENLPHYHTPLDNKENLNWGSVQHQGENTLRLTRYLADADISFTRLGNASYMDVLGFFVLYWPEIITRVLAILAFLVLLSVSILLVTQQYLKINHILWGLLLPILSLLLAIILSLGLKWLIIAVAEVPVPWYAYPLPTRIALWLAGIFSGSLVAAYMVNKATFWGAAVGVWLFWSGLTLAFAFTLTGIVTVFLLPTLFAAIVLLLCTITKKLQASFIRDTVMLMTVLFTCLIWFPLAVLLETGVGLELSPAITVPILLITITAAPFFAIPIKHQRITKRLFPVALFVTIVGAAFVAALLPPYSTHRPQRLNLIHFEDREKNQAYLVAESAAHLPPSLSESREFESEPRQIFPWSSQKSFVASAASTTLEMPDIELISDNMVENEHVLQVRLSSPRAAARLGLFIPINNLNAIVIGGERIIIDREASYNGLYDVLCYGHDCNDLVLTLHFQGESAITLLVMDLTFGLPNTDHHLSLLRTNLSVPSHDGDTTIIMRYKTF